MIKKTTLRFLALMLFFILFVETRLQAQFITIPDANFRARLQTLYPTCFGGVGGIQLNTTCPAVTSAVSLTVSNANIANLTGVEAFTGLQTLVCGSNQLTILPTLAVNLRNLDCNSNQLTTLPSLPTTLQNLFCNSNPMTSLPPLPAGLLNLTCSVSQLTSLPPLPASLQSLYCNSNLLTNLPALSTSLQNLDCYDNQITSLPALPPNLGYLECSSNLLTSLPTLPAILNTLYCRSNQLTGLPTLPPNLQRLYCASNPLMILPTFPSSLRELRCASNQLANLPLFPVGLQYVECNSNQLTSLPPLPASLQSLFCQNNQLDFADLEIINPKPGNYFANPQSYIILPATVSIANGATLTINGTIGGSLNVYQWYKNNALIIGATSATFIKMGFTSADVGTYKCAVTSTFVGAGTTTGVTITSSNVSVTLCPTITILPASASLPDGVVGSSYSQNIAQTGLTGTLTWSISTGTLLLGLSIASSTGTISGTPTTGGTSNFTVQVTNGICSQTQTYSITVHGSPCTTVTLTPTLLALPTATVGIPYSQTITATGGTTSAIYSFSTITPFPTGFSLTSAGLLSGTPTFSTSVTFIVTALTTTSSCEGKRIYTLVILPDPATATDNSLSDAVKVSPNPSLGIFNIDLEGLNVSKSIAHVYNAQGVTLYTSNANNNMSISLENLPAGLYFLEINTEKGRIIKKLIKE